MAIDFPNAPATNDTHTVGDKTWVYVDGKWTSTVGSATNASLLTSGTLDNARLPAAATTITSVGTLTSLAVTGDLTVDTTTLKVDSTNNRVGVGTATPTTALDVSGTVTATAFAGPLTGNVTGNASGTAATVTGAAQTAITSVGNLSTLTVIGSIASGTSTFKTDTSNNRVGIGTINPATTLDVIGTATVRTAATQDGVALAGRAGGTSTYEVTLTPTTLTADRTLTLPNKAGTVATTADVGLVFLNSGTFSGATTANLTSVFSATYDNYRLVISNLQGASSSLYLFLVDLLSGSTPASASYYYALTGLTYGGSADNYVGANTTLGVVGAIANADSHVVLEICRPFIADNTTISSHNASTFGNYTGTLIHGGSTSYNGIQFSNFRLGASATTISGSWKLYGYTN